MAKSHRPRHAGKCMLAIERVMAVAQQDFFIDATRSYFGLQGEMQTMDTVFMPLIFHFPNCIGGLSVGRMFFHPPRPRIPTKRAAEEITAQHFQYGGRLRRQSFFGPRRDGEGLDFGRGQRKRHGPEMSAPARYKGFHLVRSETPRGLTKHFVQFHRVKLNIANLLKARFRFFHATR